MLAQTSKSTFISLLLVVAIASAADRMDSAAEQFKNLRAELKKSKTDNDWRSNLASANRLKTLLNESPDSFLEVARAEVHLGDLKAAFREVEKFVRMGQSTDALEKLADFAPLRAEADFTKITAGMKENRKPVALGSTVFSVTDVNLLPEDVDYDANSKRFFFTSVLEKKIVVADMSGKSTDFAKAADDWPMLAIKIDSAHGVVWATEVALQGFAAAPEADWGKSALLAYDIKTGKLMRRVEGPHASALGDMVLAADGDVIVSDGEGGGIYRLTAKGAELERLDNGDYISPQTPAMHPDGKHIFVPDYLRGIGVLDLATKQVRWIPMEGQFALIGIDGLYFEDGTLLAVQNGTSPERVASFKLDATLGKIGKQTIIESATDTLGDPTHGVVVGRDFYYIANSGWNTIDEHGKLLPGAKPSPARLMRAPL
jgi:hypothetical protein